MFGSLYEALKIALVPDDKAIKAAEEIGGLEVRLTRVEVKVNILITLAILQLGLIGGIYLALFNIASRLPK